jgi:hypothetical protein
MKDQKENDTFGIAEFAELPSQQQVETMNKHVEIIARMLHKIKDKDSTAGREPLLSGLCIQALEWADPHRAPGSAFGECSIDLKQRWRLVKHDMDGNMVMATAWFTCYTIAFGSSFDDPRVPMNATDIWGTVSDPHAGCVTSKKLSKILDNAYEHWGYQGLDAHADLTKRANILVGVRASLVWTPTDEEIKDGWTVETMFSEFCYQDSGEDAIQTGPKSFGVVMGPKGSAIYSGYAGQLDLPYKFLDKETNEVMDYPTKVFASDRAIEVDGTVRKQTDDEKATTLDDDPSRAVQLKIGVNGLPSSSNLEMVMFGIQEQQPDLMGDCILRSLADEDIPEPDLMGGCFYRSLADKEMPDAPVPPTEFDEGEVVEAELGLSRASGFSMRLSVASIKSEEKDIVLTMYKRWALPFGTIPGEQVLHSVVTNLLDSWEACEKPQDDKKGPKTSKGLVESRHSERAIKLFTKGSAPDVQDILSGFKHYSTNAKALLPVEEADSEDEDHSLPKAQKLQDSSNVQ